MKKLLILGVVVLAGLWVARKVHFASYASTLWCQATRTAKDQVPIKFELNRIRDQIAGMDGEIRGMAGPIAEHMADITRMHRDIDHTRTALADHKGNLLAMTTDLKTDKQEFVYNVKRYSRASIQRKLDRDFADYQRLEKQLTKQEKLLAAKERALEASREQLNRLIAKKREFEVALAELEARNEELEIARIDGDNKVDDKLVNGIQTDINDLRHRLEKEANIVELLKNRPFSDTIQVQDPDQPRTDVDAVRAYLQGNTANSETKTASRK